MRAPVLAAILLFCLEAACSRTPEAWRAGLADEDPFRAGLCALALARVDPQGCEPALPGLLVLVDGRDPELARAARAALVDVAPLQVAFLLRMYVEVDGSSADFRSALRAALVAAGAHAVEPLRARLFDRGAANPRQLGQILADIGPSAVEPLIRDLDDANPQRRVTTAWILGRIGRPALAAVPALTHLLEADVPAIARQAALALAEVAPLDEATRPALERALERRGIATGEALARLTLQRAGAGLADQTQMRLFALGREAFVPAVEACASKQTPLSAAGERHLRSCFAGLALGLAPRGLASGRAAPELQAALDDRDAGTRALAALEVAARGARSVAFLGALAALGSDPHAGVAWSARLAWLHVVRCIALEARR